MSAHISLHIRTICRMKSFRCSPQDSSVPIHLKGPVWIIWAFMTSMRATMLENIPFYMCAQRRLKSICTITQSDKTSLSVWKNVAGLAIQNAPSEDSDQTARMRKLIWIFAGRTDPTVRFLTLRLISLLTWRRSYKTCFIRVVGKYCCKSENNVTLCLPGKKKKKKKK